MNDHDMRLRPIAAGRNVFLRDDSPAEIEGCFSWEVLGQWKEHGTARQSIWTALTHEQQENLARRFRERCLSVPRERATIMTFQDEPLGWVNCYVREPFSDVWCVGIDISEDKHTRGVGTEALELWVDYLFSNSTVYKIAVDTWSYNVWMIRVARKLGFIYEGVERALAHWQGEWLHLVHFGLLRPEWEERFSAKQQQHCD
jgi:RimJ/RimL family protein N-acetyltransferase